MRYICALTIAGSDSCGGAGVQADIKTMSALGIYAASAITSVTVQNTFGVQAIQAIQPEIVAGQIRAVMDDIKPGYKGRNGERPDYYPGYCRHAATVFSAKAHRRPGNGVYERFDAHA